MNSVRSACSSAADFQPLENPFYNFGKTIYFFGDTDVTYFIGDHSSFFTEIACDTPQCSVREPGCASPRSATDIWWGTNNALQIDTADTSSGDSTTDPNAILF